MQESYPKLLRSVPGPRKRMQASKRAADGTTCKYLRYRWEQVNQVRRVPSPTRLLPGGIRRSGSRPLENGGTGARDGEASYTTTVWTGGTAAPSMKSGTPSWQVLAALQRGPLEFSARGFRVLVGHLSDNSKHPLGYRSPLSRLCPLFNQAPKNNARARAKNLGCRGY